MTGIIERLRATALDNDNCPRMDSERWCSVGLAKEAANEIERLSEIVREDPAAWSFDTLLFIGRKMLAEVYPPDIFTGESGDSGPEFIVALRRAIARIDEKRR